MEIKKIVNGPLNENCYILIKENNCLIVDPGSSFTLLKNEVKDLNVLGILVTHYHDDHVHILDMVKNYYNAKVYDYKNKGLVNINDFNFEVIETKGHTNEACTFYFKEESVMFTGDFLFKESIGRCDLEGGNISLMKDSIKKIKTYNKNITIYPGHYKKSTLEYEFINNPYFNGGFYE